MYRAFKHDDELRGLLICGPKGCGKTASILQLMEFETEECVYVDLSFTNVERIQRSIDPEHPIGGPVLFIDNTQNYNAVPCRVHLGEKVVAVFSPGCMVHDKVGGANPYDSFGKSCGDGHWKSFPFRPLNQGEHKEFLSKVLKKKVCAVSNGVTTIDKFTSNEIFFLSAGAPRYIKYLVRNEKKRMAEEIDWQHAQCKDRQVLDRLSISYETLRDNIINLACSGRGNINLISLGLAYTLNGFYCLSNPRHLRLALEEGVFDATAWSALETFSGALILCGKQSAVNCNSERIILPHALDKLLQTEIGEIPENVRKPNKVVLLKLAQGHPVIDYILVEPAKRKRLVYFIQTSKLSYSQHKKKRDDLYNKLGKTKSCPDHLKEIKILDRYLNKTDIWKYVYATTNPTTSTDANVYIFDLFVMQNRLNASTA